MKSVGVIVNRPDTLLYGNLPSCQITSQTQAKHAGEVFQNRHLLYCSFPMSLCLAVCFMHEVPQYFSNFYAHVVVRKCQNKND
jgi:hypothetical protein